MNFVILSGGRKPELKDPHLAVQSTAPPLAAGENGFFDSLRSLRMT